MPFVPLPFRVTVPVPVTLRVVALTRPETLSVKVLPPALIVLTRLPAAPTVPVIAVDPARVRVPVLVAVTLPVRFAPLPKETVPLFAP